MTWTHKQSSGHRKKKSVNELRLAKCRLLLAVVIFAFFNKWRVLWGQGQIHRLYVPARGVLPPNAVKPSPPSHAGLLLQWRPINLTQPQYGYIRVNITAACFVYCFAQRGGGRCLLLYLPSGPQTRSQTELLTSTQSLRSRQPETY